MKKLLALLLASSSAMAAPNMLIDGSKDNAVFACGTLKTLNYAERMNMDEPLTQLQKAEIDNACYPFISEKPVTAFDIGVSSKVEVLVLDKLQILYINTRDLKRLDQ